LEASVTSVPDIQKEISLPIDGFWSGEELEFSVEVSQPEVHAAIIKRLGTPQFWDSKDDFNKKMGGCYEEISRRALEAAYGEPVEGKKKISR
jgi:uncharacterized Zn finger protein